MTFREKRQSYSMRLESGTVAAYIYFSLLDHIVANEPPLPFKADELLSLQSSSYLPEREPVIPEKEIEEFRAR
jgi:hypothetical protein